MTIDEYFNKVSYLWCEIFKFDPTIIIFKSKIERIIIHDLRLEFRSFVTVVQDWPTELTIKEFKNLFVDQEMIDKQINGGSVKIDEEALSIDEKRYRLKGHSGGGSKGDVDKLRNHQQEGSSQIKEAQWNCDNGGQYQLKKKFKGNCYNCGKRGHMAKDW